MFYDGMLDVIQQREDAVATQPKVAAFLEIPVEAVWSDGVEFDRPDLLLQWTATEEDFRRNFPPSPASQAAEVLFLGCIFQHVGANHTDIYMWPHSGKTLSSIHLTGPFRPQTEILPEFQLCAERLLEIFGKPSSEEEIESSYWPEHRKRCWETAFLKITHCITDFRESDPVNSLSIERRHSQAYFERYPNFTGA